MLDQAKVIQKMVQEFDLFSNLQESDESLEPEEEPQLPESLLHPKELTSEQLEAKTIYESAAAMLNKTRPEKQQAYQLLIDASNKGNMDAKALVAWAKLFGNPLKQDIYVAKQMFEELAQTGNPDGHTGLGNFII